MEPLEPSKTIEGSGRSRRRLSSILKAPRQSTTGIFRDTQQEENEVELPKPVEKRNSKRVSFAPANGVLLFAEDVKNASPARNPLQELMATTAATAPNWIQVAVTDDRSQQIIGIENLLNAPLHASQQRNVVNFDSASDFGEKTVVFSTDDAVMDLTQSHTINIASDADLLGDVSHHILLTRGERRDAVDDVHQSAVTSQSATLSSDRNEDSEPLLDPDFQNFLASLSKPSSSSTIKTAASTEASAEETSSEAQTVDKENQVPPLLKSRMSAVESQNRSAFCPADDVNMDLTEARTEHTARGGYDDDDDENPFQCLFPTQDMYAHCDRRSSQMSAMKLKKRRSSGLNDPRGNKPLINLPVPTPRESHKETFVTEDDLRFSAEDAFMDVTQSHTVRFTTNDADMDETRSHTVNIATDFNSELHQSVNFSLPSGEKPLGFTAVEATMDLTQCLSTNITSNLASDSAASVRKRDTTCDPRRNTSSARHSLNTGFSNPLTTISPVIAQMTPTAAQLDGFTICPDDDVSMDITEAQTGDVSADAAEVQTGRVGEYGLLQFLSHAQGMHARSVNLKQEVMTAHQQSRGEDGSSSSKETSGKSSLKTVMQRHQFDAEDDSRDKTLRFTAADVFMDVTRSHTVNIISDLPLRSFPVEEFPANATKTVRFTDEDADMDVTKSLTVKISTDLNMVSDQTVNLPPATEEKTSRFTTNDAAMDVTRSHTVNISTALNQPLLQNVSRVPAYGEKTMRFMTNDADMDVTRSHTVNIAADLNQPSLHSVSRVPAYGEKTMRFTTNDADMDVTRSHTVNIAADLNQPSLHSVSRVPAYGEKTMRFMTNDADMDVTRSHTVNIAADLNQPSLQNVSRVPAYGEKTMRFTTNDADMDVTRSHTVNIAADLNQPSLHSVSRVPAYGEKTMRFTTNDADMDVTRSHTVNIAADLNQPSLHSVSRVPAYGEKTMRFMTNDADMDVTRSHTVNIAADLNQPSLQNVSRVPAYGEKTMRFTTNDADMDVTRSHTVNIAADLNQPSPHSVSRVPAYGEKTMRFTTNDADMDVTRSHTVNISAGLNMVPDPNVMQLLAKGEKTMRFMTNDADMDVTRSHTVNIAADLNQPSLHNVSRVPAYGEKTMRFTTNDAAMDVTRSHTVNIAADFNIPSHRSMELPANRENATGFAINDATMDATGSHTTNMTYFEPKPDLNVDSCPANTETARVAANKASVGPRRDAVNMSASFEPKSQNVAFHPPSGDKTVRFTTSDASMEMTRCLTVNIANDPGSDLVLMDQNVLPAYENVGFPTAVRKPDRSDSYSSQLEQGFQEGDPSVEFEAEATNAPLPQESADSSCFQRKTLKPETSAEDETPSLVSGVVKQPANETTVCAETSAGVDVTEPQSGALRPASTDHSQNKVSWTQDDNSDHLKKTELTSLNTEGRGLPTPDDVDSNKMETMTAQQPRTETFPSSQKADASDAGQDVATLGSKTSRQRSFADLQSKLRRLSGNVKAAPHTVDGSAAPPPQLDPDLEKNSSGRTTSLPEVQPELNTSLPRADDNTGAQSRAENPSTAANATPFSLKTQQLMSRLSVGGFKPKLPKRNNPGESKKPASTEEATRTFADNITSRLRDLDSDVEYVFNEELVSCEDMSDTVDTRTPEKITENQCPSEAFHGFDPAEEGLFKEPYGSPLHSRKRPRTEGDDEDEKRLKTCAELVEPEFQPAVESDAKVAAAHMTTQTDSSSNSSRYEAASESNFKPSLFESQLEDYGSDEQNKLKDGTITVLEFFSLFNIDFVTHNPRQSVLPGRLSSDADVTPLDLLKNRHINRPKQMVYKADIQTLTAKVEELNVRLQVLNKPLRVVNQRLWEEMRHFSEEELRCFRAKLKERNNFFRKTSREKSHETKEVLYSELVQVNLEEQQKLRGTISKADEMLKQLDGCISELETEINAVMEEDSKDKKCLKTLQEEFTKITEAVADNDRLIAELELQKKQNSSTLKKLKTEMKNLQSEINTLSLLNEWRIRDTVDDCTTYTFLHNTLLLQLTFEKLHGNDAGSGSERKITNVSFRFDLDDDESQFHACLVHKLVSQHIEGQSSWVDKYPTSRHVPKLLHDVSLVVSPFRLLGEELRLLKMWGALRFDILDIGRRETQVYVVFSCLKKLSKFEVVFAVGLENHQCVFQVQSFRNIFGDTTIQRIEEIVASLTSDTKLFTKIVKKIHDTLLC